MEIMAIFLVSLAPFVIGLVTQFIKRLESIRFSENKAFIVRFIVAVLSLLAAIGTAMLAGTEVDQNAIKVFSDALLVFLSATGAYFLGKK